MNKPDLLIKIMPIFVGSFKKENEKSMKKYQTIRKTTLITTTDYRINIK